ncbi:MAG: hypothetical protein ACI8QS_000946 [Planctomycetota bacterium]|jgi:hypothetical protein
MIGIVKERPSEHLQFKWHALLLFCWILPPILIAVLSWGRFDLSVRQFRLLVAVWVVAHLLWIPVLVIVISRCMLRDILLVAFYPILSFFAFPLMSVILGQGWVFDFLESWVLGV